MDPVSVGGAALSGAAGTSASTSVTKSYEKWGWKAIATHAAVIVAILAIFQAFRTKSMKGIFG